MSEAILADTACSPRSLRLQVRQLILQAKLVRRIKLSMLFRSSGILTGLVGMTLPMARDLARYGIRVVGIAPSALLQLMAITFSSSNRSAFDTAMGSAIPNKAKANLLAGSSVCILLSSTPLALMCMLCFQSLPTKKWSRRRIRSSSISNRGECFHQRHDN